MGYIRGGKCKNLPLTMTLCRFVPIRESWSRIFLISELSHIVLDPILGMATSVGSTMGIRRQPRDDDPGEMALDPWI